MSKLSFINGIQYEIADVRIMIRLPKEPTVGDILASYPESHAKALRMLLEAEIIDPHGLETDTPVQVVFLAPNLSDEEKERWLKFGREEIWVNLELVKNNDTAFSYNYDTRIMTLTHSLMADRIGNEPNGNNG